MKEIFDYLLPFQAYAKLFVSKIHPDRHHGYPDIQKINASATSIINDIFKFKNKLDVSPPRFYDLNFFIWKSNSKEHAEIAYKLMFKIPFDYGSAKSSIGLFKSAEISVDNTILDSIPKSERCPVKTEQNVSFTISEGIKTSCFNLDHDYSNVDIREIRDFLHRRPYIQFEGLLADNVSQILQLSSFISLTINRLESQLGSKMPLIIISDRFHFPELRNGIINVPLSSNFKGNRLNAYTLSNLLFRYLFNFQNR